MQTVDVRSIEATAAPVSTMRATVSAGWLVRRAALWMLIVALGVAGACLLYTAASKAEADSITRTQSVGTHPVSAEPAVTLPASAKQRS